MSHERAPTNDRGASTGYGTAVFDDRPGGAELDALFEALADQQRRRILAYLDDCEGDAATVADLTDGIAPGVDAASASSDSGDDASTGERERVATRLHHVHLPKLAEVGLVEFDDGSGVVRYRGGAVVSDWLELARSD
ncbi:ArsR/SmtB family transcription factor [Halorussus halobius]|uniref:ArsR/SmtB family transcription factor n=1 Tax=Halorussus halobius TaxID=1710537 RepID=UPI001B2FF03F|nr:helix-turn-helix transcriptional regulator [Halorussus halobius]